MIEVLEDLPLPRTRRARFALVSSLVWAWLSPQGLPWGLRLGRHAKHLLRQLTRPTSPTPLACNHCGRDYDYRFVRARCAPISGQRSTTTVVKVTSTTKPKGDQHHGSFRRQDVVFDYQSDLDDHGREASGRLCLLHQAYRRCLKAQMLASVPGTRRSGVLKPAGSHPGELLGFDNKAHSAAWRK